MKRFGIVLFYLILGGCAWFAMCAATDVTVKTLGWFRDRYQGEQLDLALVGYLGTPFGAILGSVLGWWSSVHEAPRHRWMLSLVLSLLIPTIVYLVALAKGGYLG